MTCEDIKNLISEYIDGMAENSDEIKQHMDSCEECRRYFEEIERTKNLCNSVAMTPLPSGFKERLDTKLKKIERVPWYKNRKMYISAAGLAACLVIAIGPVYKNYEDISVDINNTETASVSGISEESNNIVTAPQVAEENRKSEISAASRTADYLQDTSADKVEKEVVADMTEKADEDVSQNADFTSEISVPQEEPVLEQVSLVVAPEEKHLQTPAYSPEEDEAVYNEHAKEENETLIEQPTEEIQIPVSEKRSGGGSGAAEVASSAENREGFSLIYVFSPEIKEWFDENIGSPNTIEYDGEEIYIISESELAMLIAEADEQNISYNNVNADLPSGYYVSFTR